MSDANVDVHLKQGGKELHIGKLVMDPGSSIEVDANSKLNVIAGLIRVFNDGSLVVDPGATVTGIIGETEPVGDLSTTGGIAFIHKYSIGNVTGDTDIVLDNKTLILDVWAAKVAQNGGAGDTVVVKKLTQAISSVLDMNVAIGVVVRTTVLNDGAKEALAGDILRVSAVNATTTACDVYVLGMRIT